MERKFLNKPLLILFRVIISIFFIFKNKTTENNDSNSGSYN